uniref:Uncharacterized protein n=1 Tax=Oryza sativa subsp. japonica TaxID=39947 RepID=Q69IJ1_ORYSJ|nr:hypothetical protein [Oryza sativa Japonica Group]BAD36729.1 hypothetical protein [Oryza sativa Japonica Group]
MAADSVGPQAGAEEMVSMSALGRKRRKGEAASKLNEPTRDRGRRGVSLAWIERKARSGYGNSSPQGQEKGSKFQHDSIKFDFRTTQKDADIPKLNSISEENVVNKIVEIQIIQQETKDKLYLKHNSSGICNTKSAYKETFGGRLLREALPSSQRLNFRINDISPDCCRSEAMLDTYARYSSQQKTQDLQQDNESTRRMNSSTIFLTDNKTIANSMKKRNFEADPRHVSLGLLLRAPPSPSSSHHDSTAGILAPPPTMPPPPASWRCRPQRRRPSLRPPTTPPPRTSWPRRPPRRRPPRRSPPRHHRRHPGAVARRAAALPFLCSPCLHRRRPGVIAHSAATLPVICSAAALPVARSASALPVLCPPRLHRRRIGAVARSAAALPILCQPHLHRRRPGFVARSTAASSNRPPPLHFRCPSASIPITVVPGATATVVPSAAVTGRPPPARSWPSLMTTRR